MAGDLFFFLYGQVVPRCQHDIDKHFDGYYTLQYMNAGAVDLSVDQQRFRMEGKWFFSCWPGPRISFRAAPPHQSWSHRFIAFSGEIAKSWEHDRIFPVWPQSAPKGLDYAGRFDELLQLADRGDAWGTRRAINGLEAILIELAEAREGHAASDPWLESVLRELHNSANGEAPDYERLAAAGGVSLSTFRRRFRSAMGISPHEYLLRSRISSARQLLAATDQPIKQIAQQLGYNDVFFFTRQFSKEAGVSPAKYRRSCQG